MEDLRPASSASIDLAPLIERGESEACAAALDGLGSGDATRLVSRLSDDARAKLLALLPPDDAADLISHLPEPQALDAIEDLPAGAAARIIEELPSDAQADFIGELDEADAGAILSQLSDEDAEDVRRLAAYSDDVAGGLMVTEHLRYDESMTVAKVIEDLGRHAGEYADYDIQYAYVTDSEMRLIGVLRMRDLLLSSRSRVLRDIMIRDPQSVRDDMKIHELDDFFEAHRYFGAPVVDAQGRLCGVVQRSAVQAALAEDSENVYRRSQGIVGGEELRTMPLLLRSRRRLSWLSVNIVLNIIAASVIAMHEATLEAVIALAVFLPIISDMSGCSGNQAVAVSMRELTLGVLHPREWKRAVLGELFLGVLNGFALGLLIGLVAYFWKGNVYLGLVIGGALMMNTVVAVLIGGSIPLVLKRFGVDPALGAGPILTTITDMFGFFIVLTLASAMLAQLTS